MNKCHNCKFIKYEMYNDNKCKAQFKFDTTDGYYSKQFPSAASVRGDKEDCPHYKHNWIMKIKLKIGYIQGCWYSRKFPEKMI